MFWQLVPFSRHSTLPELRRFVNLFRPNSLYPNTIKDQERFTDYFLLAFIFKTSLSLTAPAHILEHANHHLEQLNSMRIQSFDPPSIDDLERLSQRFGDGSEMLHQISDVAMVNLEGPSEAEEETRRVLGLGKVWHATSDYDDVESADFQETESDHHRTETTSVEDQRAHTVRDSHLKPVGFLHSLLTPEKDSNFEAATPHVTAVSLQPPLPITSPPTFHQKGPDRFSSMSSASNPTHSPILVQPAAANTSRPAVRPKPGRTEEEEMARQTLVCNARKHKKIFRQLHPTMQQELSEGRDQWNRLCAERANATQPANVGKQAQRPSSSIT